MKPGTIVAVAVFVLIAVAHVLRLTFGVPVVVGSAEIPAWASAAAVVGAVALALVLAREACPACRRPVEDREQSRVS